MSSAPLETWVKASSATCFALALSKRGATKPRFGFLFLSFGRVNAEGVMSEPGMLFVLFSFWDCGRDCRIELQIVEKRPSPTARHSQNSLKSK